MLYLVNSYFVIRRVISPRMRAFFVPLCMRIVFKFWDFENYYYVVPDEIFENLTTPHYLKDDESGFGQDLKLYFKFKSS